MEPPDPERQVRAAAVARGAGGGGDRLAAIDHLSRWCEGNARPERVEAFEARLVPHDAAVTRRVASWAYGQAARAKATVWADEPAAKA